MHIQRPLDLRLERGQCQKGMCVYNLAALTAALYLLQFVGRKNVIVPISLRLHLGHGGGATGRAITSRQLSHMQLGRYDTGMDA